MPQTLESHVEYTRREWESPYYQECIKYINDKSKCISFVDLGGCVGEVSNVIMERISSLRTLHIVEPVRENFEYIVERFNGNIEKDELKNCCSIEFGDKIINVYNKAIYYGSGEIILGQLSNYTNVGGWSYSDNHKQNIIESIKTMGLEEIDETDIIKIDIEGLELNLLQNSKSIKKFRFIFLELHDDLLENYEELLEKYLPGHNLVYKENQQFFLELL
jgi:FkbM family methyltransferase